MEVLQFRRRVVSAGEIATWEIPAGEISAWMVSTRDVPAREIPPRQLPIRDLPTRVVWQFGTARAEAAHCRSSTRGDRLAISAHTGRQYGKVLGDLGRVVVVGVGDSLEIPAHEVASGAVILEDAAVVDGGLPVPPHHLLAAEPRVGITDGVGVLGQAEQRVVHLPHLLKVLFSAVTPPT